MTRLPSLFRATLLLASTAAALAAATPAATTAPAPAPAATTSAAPANDRKPFATTSTLSTEASTLVKILEQAHYNHDNVKAPDYAQVVKEYMGDLDGQRLFFLASDHARFMREYGGKVYYNIAFLGNLEAAGTFEIFQTYSQRVESRVAWVLEQLKGEFDFSAPETYRADRSKMDWPADATAADDLWRRRLKFELVDQLLNKKTMDEARTIVRKRYERMRKNLLEIEGNELCELFLSNIARLYDPHSTYFSAQTFEDFGIQMKLQLVGIGALLGLEEEVCVVKEIIPGGPADVAKVLRPNDKIISVAQNGAEPVEIIGMKLRKIVDLIRGAEGTKVTLMIQPGDATDSSARREIVITRGKVKLEDRRARAAVFQLPGQDGKTQPLGVITLPAFYGPADDGDTDREKTTASRDVARLITQLKGEGVQGIVLDLRRNGGGYLTEAIDLAGLFIQQGPVVQVKAYNGEVQVDRDTNAQIAWDGPLAVLVDRFSASASEIVAGALQNYGRAVVIGDRSTHGKGTVQQVVEMKSLSRALAYSPVKTGAVKFTIQKYYLPSGDSTQLKGVVADISLPSINEFLPIGESDLPRALVWDQIPSSRFDGAPLDARVLGLLREASVSRQEKLEEFSYLRRNVARFKERQDQKLISVRLEERQKQKADDDAFRKEMKVEKERIAKGDYPFRPFYLGAPPLPKVKPAKKPEDKGEDDEAEADEEENETYVKADIHLREALRVLSDGVGLAQRQELWAANRPPLTAITRGG